MHIKVGQRTEDELNKAALTSSMWNPARRARTMISIWKTYPFETTILINFSRTGFLYNLHSQHRKIVTNGRCNLRCVVFCLPSVTRIQTFEVYCRGEQIPSARNQNLSASIREDKGPAEPQQESQESCTRSVRTERKSNNACPPKPVRIPVHPRRKRLPIRIQINRQALLLGREVRNA